MGEAQSPLSAKGLVVEVSFDGRMLTVVPRRVIGRKTEKRIPIGSVKSVEWKSATRLMQGQLTLVLPDDKVEAKFSHGSNDDFSALRDAVEAAMAP